MNRRALQPRIRLLLQSNAPREQTLLLRKCFFHHFELFGRVHINKAAAHRLGLEHFGLRKLAYVHFAENALRALLACLNRRFDYRQAGRPTIERMERLEAVLVDRDHHISARCRHNRRLACHQRRRSAHHVARHDGNVFAFRRFKR